MSLKISNRGFSIIGSLLGFSLLGLSTVGLATYMGSFEQVKVTYARQSNINFMHSELLGNMEKVITMTKTEISGAAKIDHNKKEHGLCKIVKDSRNGNTYNKFKDKAICAIMLEGDSVIAPANYADDRWTYFVQGGNNWEISSNNCANGKNGFAGSFTEDVFNKCVTYVGKSETAGIYARLIMEPQSLPGFKEITSSDNIPVDELVYKFKSVISIPKELEPNNPDSIVYSLSKGEKYLWSAEVLDCHICSGNNCKLARFSTASQGTAARHSRICYHSPYETQEKKDALEILVEKIPPEFKVSGDRITTLNCCHQNIHYDICPAHILALPPDDNCPQQYSSSCRSNLFRCGNQIDKNDFDPALKFRFLLNYDQSEDSYINEMDLKITNGSDDKEYGTLFVSADQQARVGRKSSSTPTPPSTPETFTNQEWPLRAGTNEITAFMADQDSSGNSICADQVCSGGSYYPNLTVKYGGANCDGGSCSENLGASNREIACFQCNMKSCHRYGVGTHASANASRDNEPLDGVVPECMIEDAISTTPDLTQITGASTIGNQCLQTTSGGLQTVTCTNTTGGGDPVFKTGTTKSACFSEGKTKVLEGGYTGGLDARLNCMQNLQEEQLIGKIDPDNQVWREGVLPSLSMAYNVAPSDTVNNRGVKEILEKTAKLPSDPNGDKYVFNNYARFSTFFGDHNDVTDAGVFVSHQRDASGMFHSGWHRFVGVAVSGTIEQRERWAFFYREPFNNINFHDADRVGATTNPIALPTGETRRKFLGRVRPTRPIYIKMDTDFHADYPDGEQVNDNPPNHYLALIHHLAFKGIRPVKTPSVNDYPYLCRNIKATTYKEAFVTTIAEGRNINDGYSACRGLGADWYFIPPDSREFWAAALQAVAPNAPRYPFPNPFKFADGIPFWTELGITDTGYHANKRQWKLSYNYEDISSPDDYRDSKDSDHEFFFNKEREVLAPPATAWIGGLEPILPLVGATAGISIGWKPNWIEILDWWNLSDLETGDSLLFTEDLDAAQIDIIINKLNDDTDLTTNIGALNHNGRMMSVKSLRESGFLIKFKNNTTKLCRYNANVQELDFHKALIATGSGDNWPSGDDCSTLSPGSGSKSFLADHVDSIYFEIPSTPGNSNLENLTADDFFEIRKGIRPLIPLLTYHKQGAIHIQNTDKFCRAWKREKKRRAVGNCIVEKYNADTLSVGGVNHGWQLALDLRDQAECHPTGQNCDNSQNYFQSAYNTLEGDRDTAVTNRTNAVNARADARDDFSAQQLICRTTCPVCSAEPDDCTAHDACEATCPACVPANCVNRDVCVAQCAFDADPLGCEATCPACVPANCTAHDACEATCPTCTPQPDDCTAQNACQTACTAVASLTTQINNLTTQIAGFITQINQLNGIITCATPKLANSKTTCMSAIDANLHGPKFTPDIVSCSSGGYFSALQIDFNTVPDSRCHSLEVLNPEYSFTFNDGVSNLNGTVGVGVVVNNQAVTDWDKDAACGGAPTTPRALYALIPACNDDYSNLVDLDDDLCDDDVVDYDNQTCVIP